ncbi:hypothetical protein L9F63_004104 [Diploptera punctata]|uniref:Protein takeout n=1 Tax=Diploptera punctata TaxID=6984 RepID=A0AAD7ZGZ6_DIPPU|nr:hypothetical protein L9F63_004104 [Diploptera punctata]
MIRAAMILSLLQLMSCHDLPEDWIKCHRNDPQLNDCLKTAVQGVLIQLGNQGLPSLDLKHLEPLEVNEIEVQQKGTSDAVSMKIVLRNAKLHGLSKSSILKFDAHLDNYELDGETLTAVMKLEADYVINGNIFVIPVTGKGKCNVTLYDATILHGIQGKRVERGGEAFMELKKYKTTFSAKRMHSHFDNLFNGNKILGDTVNQIMNDNFQFLINEMKPSLEKQLGIILLNYADEIFKKVPFDNIFPP